ncbi:FAD-dependent oxidoreductase [Breoghania sp.]|uniref:NAD(P)/FAD-dependent oxidoreductase n=1 Tax=Breoghania sp. TaxID=2065378 RepID=UPI002620EC0A|nr:FAD-dependent oxidoreductase [Breoghania sp.]MDJ0932974.1 FAD-dependent oxidoreductase [Breoghania sp.]
MNEPIIIVGAGQAGQKAVETLRQKGYEGDLVMIGDEPFHPYQRPPLSKAYLKGEMDEERLFLRPPAYFETAAIDFRKGAWVSEIDPASHTVTLEDGESLIYSKLLIATGTRARALPIEGSDLAGVFTLRTMADIAPIRAALEAAEWVAIVGGGYIGMEFAAVAVGFGKEVTVIEVQPRILERSVAPEISNYLQDLHRSKGVRLELGSGVARLDGEGAVSGVVLANGEMVPADLVLVAVGAEPVAELAAAAGLAVEGGIAVNAACRTSAPDIYAAGDCTVFPSARFGRTIRLESVQNACDQAKAAAAAMLDEDVSYDPVPWFWSDQYDVKLQIAGLSQGYDRTEIEGSPDEGQFALSYYAGDRLLAVDTVNSPRQHMMARKMLTSQ